ncbi:hypothetical protein [Methyloglobulus sp.]|uniref:hypothetical protein n=1 Tax=Methyloglobulus sp. TaxID=2518622 RepID=UPI003989FA01
MPHKFNDLTLCWLYKFRSLEEKEIDYVERIFTHGEIYFSPISEFNDPFDCHPCYEWKGSDEEIRTFTKGFFQRNAPYLENDALNFNIESAVDLLSKPEKYRKNHAKCRGISTV